MVCANTIVRVAPRRRQQRERRERRVAGVATAAVVDVVVDVCGELVNGPADDERMRCAARTTSTRRTTSSRPRKHALKKPARPAWRSVQRALQRERPHDEREEDAERRVVVAVKVLADAVGSGARVAIMDVKAARLRRLEPRDRADERDPSVRLRDEHRAEHREGAC